MAKVISLIRGVICCGAGTEKHQRMYAISQKNSTNITLPVKLEYWDPFSYTRLQKLEYGNFGEIYVIKHNESEDLAVLKMINTRYTATDQVERERQSWEMTSAHPHIVTLRAYFDTPYTFNFVSDYMSGGDLYSVITRNGPLLLNTVKRYAGQIGSAVQYIHQIGITHRDISSKNILISPEGDARLTDFGFAMFEKCSGLLCGTPLYMAPEVIKRLKYDKAVDWWSYGVVIYFAVMGKTPLETYLESTPELPPLREMDDNTMMKFASNVEITFPKNLAASLRSFITELLRKDPKRRLGSSNKPVKKHKFLEGAPWPEV